MSLSHLLPQNARSHRLAQRCMLQSKAMSGLPASDRSESKEMRPWRFLPARGCMFPEKRLDSTVCILTWRIWIIPHCVYTHELQSTRAWPTKSRRARSAHPFAGQAVFLHVVGVDPNKPARRKSTLVDRACVPRKNERPVGEDKQTARKPRRHMTLQQCW